jgi:hypothetical protein
MSVNWDATACNLPVDESITNKREDGSEYHPITIEWQQIIDRIIWRSLVVGLGQITVENREKWYVRSEAYRLFYGDAQITPEQLIIATGFRVNVTNETDTAWRKRTFEQFTRETTASFRRVVKKQSETFIEELKTALHKDNVTIVDGEDPQ